MAGQAKEIIYDPKKRWLIQTTSGAIFPYKPRWAKRKDMKEYDPIARKAVELDRTVNINLNNTAFSVSPHLADEFNKYQGYVHDLEVKYKTLLEEVKGSQETIENTPPSEEEKTPPKTERKKPGPKPKIKKSN